MAPDRVDRIQQQWATERPELDVSPIGVIGRLHRVAARLTDQLVALYRQYGLTEGEFDLLATLRRSGELNPGELAQHTMVTTGAISKRIDRLQSAGLVHRRVSEQDGRARVVALTADGRRLIDEAFEAHLRNERRLLDELGAADTAAIEPILARWLARLEPPA
ncbi:MarR family transcriptional regulator [soil metagenome]